MEWWRRLRAIDQRWLDRRNRRYDVPPPMWITLSSLMASPLVVLAFPMVRAGGWWLAAAALAWTGWFACAVAVVRWERRHRRPKEERFDIAIDRQS